MKASTVYSSLVEQSLGFSLNQEQSGSNIQLYSSHSHKVKEIYYAQSNDNNTRHNEDIQWAGEDFVQSFRFQYRDFVLKAIEQSIKKNKKRREPKPIEQLLHDEVTLLVISKYSISFINNSFETLNLSGRKITEIDTEFKQYFQKLKELSVSSNELETLENIPNCVEILQAVANQINCVKLIPKGLMLLGLGYNRISQLSFLQYCKESIISLDLSYNDLVDLDDTLDILKILSHLHMISLKGNIFCTLNRYFNNTINTLKHISILDGRYIDRENLNAEVFEKPENVTICLLVKHIAGITKPDELEFLYSPKIDSSEQQEELSGRVEVESRTSTRSGKNGIKGTPVSKSRPTTSKQTTPVVKKSGTPAKKPTTSSGKKGRNEMTEISYEKKINYYIEFQWYHDSDCEVLFSSNSVSGTEQETNPWLIQSHGKLPEEYSPDIIPLQILCLFKVGQLSIPFRDFLKSKYIIYYIYI
jgi:hypothetical protein